MLAQALASQGEGVRVPDAKCFEGQSGRGERRWAGGRAGEAKGEQPGRLQSGLRAPSWRGITAWRPLEGSEDCRTSVHSCMVFCRA